MRNKKIIWLSVATVLLMIGVSVAVIKEKSKILIDKSITYSASYIAPQDIQNLEELSPIIVKGSFTGDRQTDPDYEYIGPSSLSDFKVDKVEKGAVKQDNIKVIEPCMFDKNKFTSIEGYTPLETGNEYILFLRENDVKGEKQYTIIGINYGKYNLSNGSDVKISSQNSTYYSEVKGTDFMTDEVTDTKLYKNLKDEVLSKYN